MTASVQRGRTGAGHTRRKGLARASNLLLAGLAAVLMLTACGSDDNPADSQIEPFIKEGGVHLQVLESRDLPYTIAIPLDYDPDVELPLVLALHFGGTVTPYLGGQFLETLVGPALSGLDGIMVAPDAIHGDFSSAEAEADLIALLDAIDQNYRIAAGKTVIVGFSMGGAAVWEMARQHPDRFGAAIPVAASPPSELSGIDWTVPMFIIHSRDDEIIPYADAEAAYHHLKDRGLNIEMIAIEGLGHFETTYYRQPLNAAIPWLVSLWTE